MMRTYNPTAIGYSGDGSGRDSYVILNNGGLTNSDQKNPMWKPTIRSTRDTKMVTHKPAVAFQYYADGSGRDSYVIRNSGGLVNEYRGSKPHAVFAAQLR